MGWITRTLGEICDEVGGIIRTGPFGSQLHQSDYQDEGLPVVMPKDIVDGTISVEGIARIGDEDVERLSQHRLKKGDIVYGRRGDIGRRALITQREAGWLCGTGCLRISLGDSVLDPTFLYYYLGEAKVIGWIYNQAIGATMPNLNTSIIRSIPITYPSLPVQHKIAAILSAYDDLIENNTRRIEILEEMARSLYREWFVNFRFPGHEQVKIVDSELGLIPEGWRYSSLKNLPIQFIDGDRSSNYPKRSEFVDDGVLFLSTKNINQDKIDLSEVNFITREKFESIKKGRVQPLDIVMTTRGSIGKVALFNCEYSTALINAQMLIIKADDKTINQIYLFYLLCSQEYQEVIKNFASGSAQPQIPIQDLKQIEILCPSIVIQRKFSEIVSSYNSLIKNLQSKNTKLRQTRDLLLPKLISGEIDVENLDINTGEIAA
jgi:type I restriction enzyme S subunit